MEPEYDPVKIQKIVDQFLEAEFFCKIGLDEPLQISEIEKRELLSIIEGFSFTISDFPVDSTPILIPDQRPKDPDKTLIDKQGKALGVYVIVFYEHGIPLFLTVEADTLDPLDSEVPRDASLSLRGVELYLEDDREQVILGEFTKETGGIVFLGIAEDTRYTIRFRS